METKMTKIVILGSGFAGVVAAKKLSKVLPSSSVTLISQHNYQLFNSNLFEVATAEEEFVSSSKLKKSVTIPLAEMLDFKKINFVQAEVTKIDQSQKFVQAGTKKIAYDYLVLATGSVSDFFGIPGSEQYSLPLKSFPDALRIKNQIEFAIQAHRLDVNKPNLRIVVAGGGYTGVEFAAELSHEIEIVAWKNQYPPEKIEIVILEAAGQLIPGFSTRLSQDALWHLKNRGVRVQLSSPITLVDEHFLTLANGEKESYDVLVWTTGVRARSLPFVEPMNLDRKGRIVTSQFLQTDKFENIFAIGDCACVINVDGKPAPPSAQDAVQHGRYVAYALQLILKNQRPAAYRGKAHGFIVTLGGKYAIMDYGGFYFKGFLAFLFRQGANFRYYLSVVGFWKALKYIIFQMDVFSRND
jgi:NADH dehydrogenase